MTAMPIPSLDLPWGRPLTYADLETLPEDGHRYELIDGVLIVDAASGPYTYADLEDLPEDGHRYELIDGVLLVSPSPVPRHQEMVARLWSILDAGRPPDLKVFLARAIVDATRSARRAHRPRRASRARCPTRS